ncbi:hypothetical protein AAC691_13340 [Nguyenibacter vanlangensis]|uniref:Uncharacterized protein n=1 Tax=Nguyenibacter vanlangensis TaxID=1216886 RepID=A0ABZ3D0X3_9PROT
MRALHWIDTVPTIWKGMMRLQTIPDSGLSRSDIDQVAGNRGGSGLRDILPS